MWKAGLLLGGAGCLQGTFLKRGTEPHMQRDFMHSGPASKEGREWVQFAPTQGTSGTDQRGAKQDGLLATVWCKCAKWAAQCSEGVGWKLSTCDIVVKTKHPSLRNHRKGKKNEAQFPLPPGPEETCKTCLVGLKSTGGFFFFFKSKKIRPGAVRKPKNPERSQKVNTNS